MASHKGCHCVDGHWSGSGEWRSKKKSIPKGLKRKKISLIKGGQVQNL